MFNNKSKKLNAQQRRALEHSKAIGKKTAKEKTKEGKAPPPRTSHYDKESGKYKTRAQKVEEDRDTVTYRWTEDSGGETVQIKTKQFLKDHAKARFEYETTSDGVGSWSSECGNHCKINKKKFDKGMDDIFGKNKKGAQNGKFTKTKKVY